MPGGLALDILTRIINVHWGGGALLLAFGQGYLVEKGHVGVIINAANGTEHAVCQKIGIYFGPPGTSSEEPHDSILNPQPMPALCGCLDKDGNAILGFRSYGTDSLLISTAGPTVAKYAKTGGAPLWTALTAAAADRFAQFVGSDASGNVYVAWYVSNPGNCALHLTKFEPSGAPIWNHDFGIGPNYQFTGLCVCPNGVTVVGRSDGSVTTVYSLSDSGSEIWNIPLASQIQSNGVNNDYFGSLEGYDVKARRVSDGSAIWTTTLDAAGTYYPTGITLGPDGAVYVSGDASNGAVVLSIKKFAGDTGAFKHQSTWAIGANNPATEQGRAASAGAVVSLAYEGETTNDPDAGRTTKSRLKAFDTATGAAAWTFDWGTWYPDGLPNDEGFPFGTSIINGAGSK